jgi:hypothetical protein
VQQRKLSEVTGAAGIRAASRQKAASTRYNGWKYFGKKLLF